MNAPAFAAALLALGLSAPLHSQTRTQRIELSNFRYAPATIQLRAGQPVTLTLVNNANGSHDFTAKEFFRASAIRAGAAPGGRVELKAHEMRSITLVPAAGTYKLHCGHFMHSAFGMTGRIVVN